MRYALYWYIHVHSSTLEWYHFTQVPTLVKVTNYKILNLKQNEIFSERLIKKIFLLNDGDINLITNNNFTKNYLILVEKTSFNKIDKDSNIYEKYEAKARLNLMNKIFSTFDNDLNINYKVKLNQKTINRVKNSF